MTYFAPYLQSVTTSFVISHCSFDMPIAMYALRPSPCVGLWSEKQQETQRQYPASQLPIRNTGYCFITRMAGALTPELVSLVLSSCLTAHSAALVPYEEKCSPGLPPGGLLDNGALPHGEPPAPIPFSTWASGLLPRFLFRPHLCVSLFYSGCLFWGDLVTVMLISTPCEP